MGHANCTTPCHAVDIQQGLPRNVTHLDSGLAQTAGLVALDEALGSFYCFRDFTGGWRDQLHSGIVPEGRQSRSGVGDRS